MENIKESISCYKSRAQRDVLAQLITNSDIEKHFFLTGGTALSVFYLHHRLSEDVDLFANAFDRMSEIDFWIKNNWPGGNIKTRESNMHLSYLINDVKVDLVVDALSINEKRQVFLFENKHSLMIDAIDNIASNKFCTLVSRTEPKDYVDFYMIMKQFASITLDDVYGKARLKDAIFDDPPTAAFQIEKGVKFFKDNPSLTPKMLAKLSSGDFDLFYEKVSGWLYNKLR